MTSIIDGPIIAQRGPADRVTVRRATPLLNIVMVDDHVLLAESLRLAWRTDVLDMSIVPPRGEATDLGRLLAMILEQKPDLVVLDIHLGRNLDGTELIAPLRRAGVKVLVLTSSNDQIRWGRCLVEGAVGVVSKSARLDEITGALHRAAQGLPVNNPAQRAELVHLWYVQSETSRQAPRGLDQLSARERQVLTALAAGRRVREIATEFFVSEATVRSHVKSILSKLGVNSQIAAVAVLHQAQAQRR